MIVRYTYKSRTLSEHVCIYIFSLEFSHYSERVRDLSMYLTIIQYAKEHSRDTLQAKSTIASVHFQVTPRVWKIGLITFSY